MRVRPKPFKNLGGGGAAMIMISEYHRIHDRVGGGDWTGGEGRKGREGE